MLRFAPAEIQHCSSLGPFIMPTALDPKSLMLLPYHIVKSKLLDKFVVSITIIVAYFISIKMAKHKQKNKCSTKFGLINYINLFFR